MYANANVHDCTWGNRPDTMSRAEQAKENDFKAYRTKWLVIWTLCNTLFGYFLNALDREGGDIYFLCLLFIGFVILFFRFVGSMLYLCVEAKSDKDEITYNCPPPVTGPIFSYDKPSALVGPPKEG
jgi:hypothetical protein